MDTVLTNGTTPEKKKKKKIVKKIIKKKVKKTSLQNEEQPNPNENRNNSVEEAKYSLGKIEYSTSVRSLHTALVYIIA